MTLSLTLNVGSCSCAQTQPSEHMEQCWRVGSLLVRTFGVTLRRPLPRGLLEPHQSKKLELRVRRGRGGGAAEAGPEARELEASPPVGECLCAALPLDRATLSSASANASPAADAASSSPSSCSMPSSAATKPVAACSASSFSTIAPFSATYARAPTVGSSQQQQRQRQPSDQMASRKSARRVRHSSGGRRRRRRRRCRCPAAALGAVARL